MLRLVLCLLCLVPVAASASSVDEQIKEVESEYCKLMADVAMQSMADRQSGREHGENLVSLMGTSEVVSDIVNKADGADVYTSEEEKLLAINGFGREVYIDCVANPDAYFR